MYKGKKRDMKFTLSWEEDKKEIFLISVEQTWSLLSVFKQNIDYNNNLAVLGYVRSVNSVRVQRYLEQFQFFSPDKQNARHQFSFLTKHKMRNKSKQFSCKIILPLENIIICSTLHCLPLLDFNCIKILLLRILKQ